jgi:hypothetical protein
MNQKTRQLLTYECDTKRVRPPAPEKSDWYKMPVGIGVKGSELFSPPRPSASFGPHNQTPALRKDFNEAAGIQSRRLFNCKDHSAGTYGAIVEFIRGGVKRWGEWDVLRPKKEAAPKMASAPHCPGFQVV